MENKNKSANLFNNLEAHTEVADNIFSKMSASGGNSLFD
jgi:hypothetical protein